MNFKDFIWSISTKAMRKDKILNHRMVRVGKGLKITQFQAP